MSENDNRDSVGSHCYAAIEQLERDRSDARNLVWASARKFGPEEYRGLCAKFGQVPNERDELIFIDGFAMGLFASRPELRRAFE